MKNEKDLDKVKDDIEKHGWHVSSVVCKETPSFSYTVGFLETFNHPEIFISGLSNELRHNLLNDIGVLIKKGNVFKNGDLSHEIIKNLPVKFVTIEKEPKKEYLRVTCAYFKEENVEALQCVWPDKSGSFLDKSNKYQEILG